MSVNCITRKWRFTNNNVKILKCDIPIAPTTMIMEDKKGESSLCCQFG